MPSSKNRPEPVPGTTTSDKASKKAGDVAKPAKDAAGAASTMPARKASDGPAVPPAARARAAAAASAAPKPAPAGNPVWLVPVMVGLMVLGLVWIVVYYVAQASLPIPGIGNWNLAIGFVLVISGFMLTMRWR